MYTSLFSFQIVWEELYKATPSCGREVGTLYYLQQSFKLVNVPSYVTKNYASCESLMLSATKSYLSSAFLTWSKVNSTNETPTYVTKMLKKDASIEEQGQFLQSYLGKFVDEFVLTEFDIEKKWEEENERRRKEKELEKSNQTMPTANTDNLFRPGKKVWLCGCYTKNNLIFLKYFLWKKIITLSLVKSSSEFS